LHPSSERRQGNVFTDAIHAVRVRREARAVAALTHPNMVTIHWVEEADVM
jgi:hypothetical protein